MDWASLSTSLASHWHVWFVSLVLIVAAVIDGWMLKVPNWITFPLIVSGWIFSFATAGWPGLGWSLAGTAVGLGLLYFLYAVGGMGAGDVKLLAGIGAWFCVEHTWNIFATTAIVGGIMAVVMVASRGAWGKHTKQFFGLIKDFATIRDSETLFQQAAARKPTMFLLPYGIPMTIAALGYFAYQGMYLP
jgi:prepilin peptidase CpaA